MNIYSFPAIVAFVINFTVAFAVFFGNTRSPANRWISAFILGLAVWNLSEIFVLASGEQQGAALAAQVLYRIVFITPAIYVIASYHFPQTVSGVTSNGLFQLGVLLLPVILLMLSRTFTSSLSRFLAPVPSTTESSSVRIFNRSRS